MKTKEYRCAYCRNIYRYGWTEEEAQPEMKENFGNVPREEQMIVCDDCFQKMIAIVPPKKIY